MTSKIICVLLILVGIINFLPLMGLLSVDRLQALYGISATEPNVQILMRHRAILFGLVGGFIIYAAFNPGFQPIAMIMAFISMAGYIVLCLQIGGFNELLRKILWVDVVGLLLLAAAFVLFLKGKG